VLKTIALATALLAPLAATKQSFPVCYPTVFHVAQRSATERKLPTRSGYITLSAQLFALPDGSSSRPFGSPAAALQRAASRNACAVYLMIENGVYAGDLTITRPTFLIGTSRTGTVLEGTIRNSTAHALRLEDLSLQNAGVPGAVIVDHPSASTYLEDVEIRDAQAYGIHQIGGSILAQHVSVIGTQATSQERTHGTAIFLEGGIHAEVYDADLTDNDSAGLMIEGAGTWAWAGAIRVSGNRFNTWFMNGLLNGGRDDGGYAAVQIGYDAHVVLSAIDVWDNEISGVHIHHGARVNGMNWDVARTISVPDPTGGSFAGINVFLDGATLDLSRFTLHHADIGIFVRRSQIHIGNGEIRNNTVGMVAPDMGAESSPWECIEDSVRFVGNETRLGLHALPFPDPFGDEEIPFDCPSVPWE
jgi:hypothetical protein